MSISSRITQIENHLEDDYKALENLGASVTDRNIENIKDMAEQIYDNYPKTSYGEGTEVTLENCNKGKLDFEKLEGDTEQDSTTGANILQVPSAELSTTSGGITMSNSNGLITLNGTATASVLVYIPCVIANGTSITIKLFNNKYQSATGNISCRLFTAKGTSASYNVNVDSANLVKTTTVTGDINWFAIRIASGEALTSFQFKPMVYTGTTDKDYEQYTGEQPSPSPTYPQTINSVTGNQEVVVRGKNIFNKDVEVKSQSINTTVGDTITFYNSSVTKTYVKGAYLKAGVTYTFSKTPNTPANNAGRAVDIVDNDGKILEYFSWLPSSSSITYTPNNSGWLYLAVDINATNIQIEQGSTATTYEPYITPITKTLTLGDRKVYEGDYLWIDKTTGKKYHHHKMNEYNLTEANNWASSTSSQGFVLARYSVSGVKSGELIYCNRFKGLTSATNRTLYSCYYNGSISAFDLCVDTTYTQETWNTYVSSHPINAVAPLATETDEEITDTTLINQVKALYNAQSITGTTIIETSGNLPIIVKVRALKNG